MARLPAGFVKRADGRLQLSFTVGGKRYYVYGQTVKECKERELEKREEIYKRIEKRKAPTFSAYASRWQDNREKTVSAGTHRTQGHIIQTLIPIPIQSAGCKFGDMRLSEITKDDILTVRNLLSDGWRSDEEKALPNSHKMDRKRSTQTVNDYMALLRHIFRDAEQERLITFNPVLLVDNLKRTEERARDTHHRALTVDEQKLLFGDARTKECSYFRIFKMAILTGMRCGEIGALQNRDIYDDHLVVERTVTRSNLGYYISDDAKTEAGRRKLPLTDRVKELLTEQAEYNLIAFGEMSTDPRSTVFKAPEGGILISTPADRVLKSLCVKIGIEPITMHGLRATYATRCIEAGMNPRTLQELLGHTNFNLTMSLYGHVIDETKKSEASNVVIDI